ncbi:ankyrin [Periconia macrospinosa]|uniref:Ankyrin n=1 Tax=Periconia macrospinosa TaxID=97972 RepID=A0A2V1DH04_9PLEO|nr:ankyrin [Periconia macrospinosa]
MLANKISNARICVLEYASQWFGKGAVDQRVDQVAEKLLYYIKQNRSDHNKTPIIFVAHCLGGIILEKALLFSRLRQAVFPSIFPYIVGCVFLGTPFRGTKTQKKALALANMAEMVGLGVASSLLKVLEEDSELLMDMLDDFVRLTKEAQIRVFCFYEAQKSNIMSPFTKSAIVKQQEKIVDKAHATFPGVESLDLDSDHFGMNKYASPKDANFDLVAAQIKETANRAPRILKSRENSASAKLVNESKYRELLDFLRENFSDLDSVVKGLYRRKNIADVAASANVTQSESKDSNSSWIIEDEAFSQWREAKASQLLWIHGPTVQKSIASSVIEDLEKMNIGKSDEQESIVLSFFCAESDEYRRAFPSVLKLLIRQMIAADQDLAVHLLSDTKDSKKSGKQDFDKEALSKTAVLWDALQNMVASYAGRVYILVYGVDELSEDSLEQFLGYLRDVPGKNEKPGEQNEEPAIKWVLLTRLKRPDVIKALKGRAHEIDFADEKNAEKVNDDLWGHISFQVDQLKIAAPLKYFLKRHIHSRAQGNEVYVSLVIQEVKNKQAMGQVQHADIRALLESFPYGLTNMYEHIRKRVLTPTSEGIEYTKEILRCLALAQRAPTLRELAIMADLPHEDETDLETLKRYVIQCGSFVTLRGADYDEEAMTVEWIDSTARIHLENFAKDELAMDLRKMQHGIIALRCLQYVYAYTSGLVEAENDGKDAEEDSDTDEEDDDSDSNSEAQGEDDSGSTGTHEAEDDHEAEENQEDNDHEAGENQEEDNDHEAEDNDEAEDNEENESSTENRKAALKYPMENWLEHAKLSDPDVISEFGTGHAFWEKESPLRQSWWDDLSSLQMFESQTNVSALHVAALADYPALVEYLLKNGWDEDIHQEDSLGFQPLCAACHVGNNEIVQQILDAGADIHYISGSVTAQYKATALSTAAENGHRKIVQTLIDRGADINTTSEDWGTPL